MMKRRKPKRKVVQLHPINPLPSLQIRVRLLTRGTAATDFGLNAIFAPKYSDAD